MSKIQLVLTVVKHKLEHVMIESYLVHITLVCVIVHLEDVELQLDKHTKTYHNTIYVSNENCCELDDSKMYLGNLLYKVDILININIHPEQALKQTHHNDDNEKLIL